MLVPRQYGMYGLGGQLTMSQIGAGRAWGRASDPNNVWDLNVCLVRNLNDGA